MKLRTLETIVLSLATILAGSPLAHGKKPPKPPPEPTTCPCFSAADLRRMVRVDFLNSVTCAEAEELVEPARTLTLTTTSFKTGQANRTLAAVFETDPLGNVIQSRCDVTAFGPEEPPGIIVGFAGLTRPQVESCRDVIRRYAVDHLGKSCLLIVDASAPWP